MSKLPSFRKSRHGILGVSYQFLRVAQFITLIIIIGLAANFVAKMIEAKANPPSLVVAILSLVSLSYLVTSHNFTNIIILTVDRCA
jgi:hypothetical protein